MRPRLPDGLVIRPGEVTQVDIPLEPAVKVRGVIRSKETKEPLGEATIIVQYDKRRQSDRIETGPDGTHEAYVVPGDVMLQVVVDPVGYVQIGAPWAEPVHVANGPATFELPPVELVKQGPTIAGKLVDGRDRPLPGVRLIGATGNRRYGFATTDANGAFQMKGVPAGLALTYTAWTEDEHAVPAEVVSADPLVLRARLARDLVEEAEPNATISARVVDSGGKPVGGAELILSETVYGPGNRVVSGRTSVFGVTDALGSIRKAHALVKGSDYRLIVQPGDVTVAGSQPIKADGLKPIAFPPIIVERVRGIGGFVVDSGGKPVAGATVLNWGNAGPLTVATSGDDGSFRLDRVPPGGFSLFAEAPEYRFHGQLIASEAEPIRLVLQRRDASPPRKWATLGPALPRKEAAELARKLITPYADRALAGSDRDASARALEVLALIDPESAWAKIRGGDPIWDRDAAKIAVFRLFRDERPEDARAVLPLIKTPFWRFYCMTEQIDALPEDQAARKKKLLAEAIAAAREIR